MSNAISLPNATDVLYHKTQLYLYDTLTAQKRVFTPIQEGKVGIYVCGMTVYDYCHIGHARVMVVFDMIVRWLKEIGYDVNYVRNITDIDDKIIKRAEENGEAIGELTTRFIQAMHQDADALGCLRPNHEPKATEHIDDMQRMIDTLIHKQHAYPADNGDVYYAVDSFESYGKLSKRQLEDMQAGSRVDVDEHKRNPFDFVLWKSAKPQEPHWQSPWGNGRPGWHIECSAMSTKCLGHSFDIHGGGHDLQFPHHENEIAQSEGATGCEYARNWMHVGFINVDGEKMSKSLGNFFTIRDVIANYHPETVRFFILSSHYRSQVNFSDTALNEAHNGLSRLYHALKSVQQLNSINSGLNSHDESIKEAKTAVYQSEHGQDFIQAMNDDFNTVSAISVLFALAREINRAVKENDVKQAKLLANRLKTLAQPLNILQQNASEFLQARIGQADDGISDDEIEALIAERAQAKADKNYQRADQIRHELKEQGIELEDSRQGTTWRRV